MAQKLTAQWEHRGTGGIPAVQPDRRAVSVLTLVIAVLSSVAALAGVLTAGRAGTQEVTSLRGAPVTLYGEGLFALDTWLIGVGNRGQDAIVLLVEIPLLLAALVAYRRGSLRGHVALAGVLSFFLYDYASMTFATAQNRVFPLYVAVFAASLFAFVRVFSAIDADLVSSRFPRRPSRPFLVGYLLAVAAALTAAWLPSLIAAAVDAGQIPAIVGPYTSSVTHALDLGVIAPVVVLAAVLLRRRTPLGHVMTLTVLVLNVSIGLVLMGQGAAQLLAGVPMTPGEIVSKMLTFAALTVVAGWVLVVMARTRRSDGRRAAAVARAEGAALVRPMVHT
jgi:hypothetical protein